MNTGLAAINPPTLSTRLHALVSVRDVAEALQAADAGVDTIDLKDPSDGALGGLPLPVIAAIVAALRAWSGTTSFSTLSISATVGDWPAPARAAILRRVDRVAACGVDQVKVGVALHDLDAAVALIDALAAHAHASGIAIVPVLIADDGVAPACVAAVRRGGFAAVMLDTADKRGGSLLQRRPLTELVALLTALRGPGTRIGLAGALMPSDIPVLRALRPDYAGFRSAVCAGDRRLGLDPVRLATLLVALG